MLLPLAIYLVNGLLLHNFVLLESHSIVLEESADFKVDETFDNGLKIDHGDRKLFRINTEENKHDDLNRLASDKYQKSESVHRFRPKTRQRLTTFTRRPNRKFYSFTKLHVTKPSIKNKDVSESTQLSSISYEYQYDEILKEYYDESIKEGKSNQTYHTRKNGRSENVVLSTLEEIIPLDGLSAFGHIIMNLIRKREVKDPQLENKVLVQKLWRFIKIMLIIYIILAIPLWCTKGWCCCCLFCKLFKPRRTIDVAKVYLTRNPPGILTKRGHIHAYEPTNQERESYEEFEHLIRTT